MQDKLFGGILMFAIKDVLSTTDPILKHVRLAKIGKLIAKRDNNENMEALFSLELEGFGDDFPINSIPKYRFIGGIPIRNSIIDILNWYNKKGGIQNQDAIIKLRGKYFRMRNFVEMSNRFDNFVWDYIIDNLSKMKVSFELPEIEEGEIPSFDLDKMLEEK